MKNNHRMLIIFSIIFTILLIAILLQNEGIMLPTTRPIPTNTSVDYSNLSTVFTGFNEFDIVAVRLGNPVTETSLTLTRTNDGSWATPDIEGVIDQQTADIIMGTMVLLPYAQIIKIQPDQDLAQYGFVEHNPYALSIEIILIDGSTHGLFIGLPTPDGNSFYALVDDDEKIYLLNSQAVEFLRFQLVNPPIRLTSD